MNSGDLSRRLRLGRLVYLGWHRPRGVVATMRRDGIGNTIATWRGAAAMKRAAAGLAPTPCGDTPERVALLTGRRHWHQTVFCVRSLQRRLDRPMSISVFDDGTLDGPTTTRLRRLLPGVTIVAEEESERRLDHFLPADRFPALRQHRSKYVYLRKLTDVHVGHAGPTISADSDMLFLRRPTLVLDHARTGRPVYMQDFDTAYGYPIGVLSDLAGVEVRPVVNVGLVVMDSAIIEWDRVEEWCRLLLERYGSHYYLEQALTAMILSRADASPLPRTDYIVKPTAGQSARREGILHHYVAASKAYYLQTAWRDELQSPAPSP